MTQVDPVIDLRFVMATTLVIVHELGRELIPQHLLINVDIDQVVHSPRIYIWTHSQCDQTTIG